MGKLRQLPFLFSVKREMSCIDSAKPARNGISWFVPGKARSVGRHGGWEEKLNSSSYWEARFHREKKIISRSPEWNHEILPVRTTWIFGRHLSSVNGSGLLLVRLSFRLIQSEGLQPVQEAPRVELCVLHFQSVVLLPFKKIPNVCWEAWKPSTWRRPWKHHRSLNKSLYCKNFSVKLIILTWILV